MGEWAPTTCCKKSFPLKTKLTIVLLQRVFTVGCKVAFWGSGTILPLDPGAGYMGVFILLKFIKLYTRFVCELSGTYHTYL